MALTPIDMKGMIPRTHEISDMENNKNIKERDIQFGNQREQEKRTQQDLNQIKESEKSQGERIKRESKSEDLSKKKREGKKKQSHEKNQEDRAKEDSLNISVDSSKIKVGKKIDMKV